MSSMQLRRKSARHSKNSVLPPTFDIRRSYIEGTLAPGSVRAHSRGRHIIAALCLICLPSAPWWSQNTMCNCPHPPTMHVPSAAWANGAAGSEAGDSMLGRDTSPRRDTAPRADNIDYARALRMLGSTSPPSAPPMAATGSAKQAPNMPLSQQGEAAPSAGPLPPSLLPGSATTATATAMERPALPWMSQEEDSSRMELTFASPKQGKAAGVLAACEQAPVGGGAGSGMSWRWGATEILAAEDEPDQGPQQGASLPAALAKGTSHDGAAIPDGAAAGIDTEPPAWAAWQATSPPHEPGAGWSVGADRALVSIHAKRSMGMLPSKHVGTATSATYYA